MLYEVTIEPIQPVKPFKNLTLEGIVLPFKNLTLAERG